MASLALFGVASIFLGKAAAGGSALAAIGIAASASLGSALDNQLIFPSLFSEDRQAGSLGSLQVNPADEGSATYAAIGKRVRVPGQVVYAGPPQKVTSRVGGGKRGSVEVETYYRDMAYSFLWNAVHAFEQFDMNGEAVWRANRTRTVNFSWDESTAQGKHSLGSVGESTAYPGGFSFDAVQEWELRSPLIGTPPAPPGYAWAWYLKSWYLVLRNLEGFLPDELSQFVAGEDVTVSHWNPTFLFVFGPIALKCLSAGQVGQHPNGDPIYEIVLDMRPYWEPNQLGSQVPPTDPLVHWAGPVSYVPLASPFPPAPAAPRVQQINYPILGYWNGLPGAYVEVTQTFGQQWKQHLLRNASSGEFYTGQPGVDQTSPTIESLIGTGNVAGNVNRAMLVLPQMNQSMFNGVSPNVQCYVDARATNPIAGTPRDTTVAEGIHWLLSDQTGIPYWFLDTGFKIVFGVDPVSTRLTGEMRGLVVASMEGVAATIAQYMLAFDLFMTEHSGKVYVDAISARPSLTIPWGRLDARRLGAPPSRAIDQRDAEDVSRPQRLDIEFTNFNRDNQLGNKHSRFDGIGDIGEIDRAGSQMTTGAVTLNEAEAQDVVDRLHRRQYGREKTSTVRLSQRDLEVVPGDVLISTNDRQRGPSAGKTYYFVVQETQTTDDLLILCRGTVAEVPPDGWTPPT